MAQVAIIIPTHNNLKHLIECLDSIYKNIHFSDFRVIVIASECTDGTVEFLNFSKRTYKLSVWDSSPKEGSIKAVNEGISLTGSGEDVYVMHDDVTIPRCLTMDWLGEMRVLADLPQTGLIMPANGGGISGPDYVEGLRWVGTWGMYIPRRTLEAVGVFDDNMKIGEDIDYSYRVQKAGLKIEVIPFLVNHHQQRTTPHQDQSEEIKKEAALYFKKKHGLN